MRRVILLVMDSVGIGAAPDAAAYGDSGADTLGHIVAAAGQGRAHDHRRANAPLALPCLAALGLGAVYENANNTPLAYPIGAPGARAAYAWACPRGRPKGSTGGHWEIAGHPVTTDWGYLGQDPAAPYPKALLDGLTAAAGPAGVIVVGRASGTDVLAEHGAAHIASGRPIVYTSADSVLQIAAHEQYFGLAALYRLCEQARRLCDDYGIARVIARPFVGETAATFTRTDNRRDYAMPPPGPTLLDRATAAGVAVTTFGKIGDLFAHRAIARQHPATGLDSVFDSLATALAEPAGDKPALWFVNFCDFDSVYGHRRDVTGYARELARFDARLPALLNTLGEEDLLIVTADHGNDPTFAGSDHTREMVPVLLHGSHLIAGSYGPRDSFADIGATAAAWLGLGYDLPGRSLIE